MAKLNIDFGITVSIDAEEFRLLSLALSRKLRGADVEPARELGKKLADQRAAALDAYMVATKQELKTAAVEPSLLEGTGDKDGDGGDQ